MQIQNSKSTVWACIIYVCNILIGAVDVHETFVHAMPINILVNSVGPMPSYMHTLAPVLGCYNMCVLTLL